MTLALTGVSGPFGRLAAENVLDQVDPHTVVLLTRHPDAVADLADRGATVVEADFDRPATLTTTLSGVDRLLLVSTDAVGRRVTQHTAVITAAAAAGVDRVVYTSVPRPVPGNPSLVVPDHAGTEQALRDSGMAWTFLRNNMYAHMQLPGLEGAAASGRWVTNAGHGATAFVTRADAAAAAAAALVQGGHRRVAYDITGPHAWAADELAALADHMPGDRGGVVTVAHVDDDQFAEHLRGHGLPDHVVDLVTSIGASARAGYLDGVTTAVEDLTGRPASPLERLLTRSSR